MVEPFKMEQLLSNLNHIKRFCSDQKQNAKANEQLAGDCDKLIGVADRIYKMADEFIVFEKLPQNGFFTFLDIATAYTDQIVKQINEEQRVDADLQRMFSGLFLYGEFLPEICEELKSEQNEAHDGPSLMQRANCMRSRHIYRAVK